MGGGGEPRCVWLKLVGRRLAEGTVECNFSEVVEAAF